MMEKSPGLIFHDATSSQLSGIETGAPGKGGGCRCGRVLPPILEIVKVKPAALLNLALQGGYGGQQPVHLRAYRLHETAHP